MTMHIQIKSHKTMLSLNTSTVINLILKGYSQFMLLRVNSRTKICISQPQRVKTSSPQLLGNFCDSYWKGPYLFSTACLKIVMTTLTLSFSFFVAIFSLQKSDLCIITLSCDAGRQFILLFADLQNAVRYKQHTCWVTMNRLACQKSSLLAFLRPIFVILPRKQRLHSHSGFILKM